MANERRFSGTPEAGDLIRIITPEGVTYRTIVMGLRVNPDGETVVDLLYDPEDASEG